MLYLSRVTAGAALTALALSACTAEGDGSPAAAPTATVTVTTTPASSSDDGDVQDAITIESMSSGTTCYDRPYPDLAWLDVTYEVLRDVEHLDFSLVDSDGVRSIGPAIDLPPTNFGGTIAFGGEYAWPDRAELREQRQVSWAGRNRVDFYSATEGRTGLLMFHLRFDDDVLAGERAAEIGTVRATWSGEDEPEGQVEVPVEQTISFRPADCR
ncbi:hypothetical protein [Nocardioides sp. OK12]|uniref:hypothetical protein n=1 Tax=Nocardioides sp. OK12 TaxID=2758661 RepID=UPI0021C3AA37|nr:hypothetical protein [Nocardioides sp. OK12]